MRAIDLYSGIGGWTLGLKMAGIDVVASYEWWKKANKTHNANFGTNNKEINIRELDLDSLPKNIDIVVGSPPCTQFSYANRGGSGDIEDGLIDIRQFLRVVRHLKPRYWVMENVPRVAKILEKEREQSLVEFKDLLPVITVINMSDLGLPQGRKRAIVGSFPLDLLEQYKGITSQRYMGDVLKGLSAHRPVDVNYGLKLARSRLTENEPEDYLNEEERRMNEEAKCHHPIYNKMAFPDQLYRPSRTITATCTRVSRESVVLEDPPDSECFRRLTVRERATLQGFPISYQFYGDNYSEKVKMVGNAIPPLFTYYLALGMRDIPAEKIIRADKLGYVHQMPTDLPVKTKPENGAGKYPEKRKFRVAIKGLRFGSGMRFELANIFVEDRVIWSVNFYYGTSKDIRTLELNKELSRSLIGTIKIPHTRKKISSIFKENTKGINNKDTNQLQKAWAHEIQGTGPFEVADALGDVADAIVMELSKLEDTKLVEAVLGVIDASEQVNGFKKLNGNKKFVGYSKEIFAGCLVGAQFNEMYSDRSNI